jgi:hypothetical protein
MAVLEVRALYTRSLEAQLQSAAAVVQGSWCLYTVSLAAPIIWHYFAENQGCTTSCWVPHGAWQHSCSVKKHAQELFNLCYIVPAHEPEKRHVRILHK